MKQFRESSSLERDNGGRNRLLQVSGRVSGRESGSDSKKFLSVRGSGMLIAHEQPVPMME